MDEQTDYEQYSTIVDMHKFPRFGYTSDIAQLASNDLKRQHDYIYGVVSFTAILFSFFVIWSLALLIFKWKGSEKCGCISGQVTEKADFESKTKALRRHRSIKFFFLLNCCGILIGIILILKEGMPRMKETIFDVRELNKVTMHLIFSSSVHKKVQLFMRFFYFGIRFCHVVFIAGYL